MRHDSNMRFRYSGIRKYPNSIRNPMKTASIATRIRAFLWISVLAGLPVTVKPQSAVLLHRYSFDGPSGSTTITDSVGNASGTLMNGTTTATLTGSGQLALDGNTSKGYVLLPAGLLNTLTNAIFETWVKAEDFGPSWAELWTFGTNNGSTGVSFLSMIPDNPVNSTIRLDAVGSTATSLYASESLPYTNEVCLTVSYNLTAQTAAIYVNGQKVASGAETLPLDSIPDPDNYLGQSQFYGAGDPYFNGTLDEFRIYSGTDSDLQVAFDAAAGPNNFVTDPGTLVSLQFNNVSAVFAGAKFQPIILADYSLLTNVNLSTIPGVAYSSDNTNVVAYETNGYFQAIGAGTTTIRASYQSVNTALTITVSPPSATLLHEYSFNGPATSSDGAVIADSVGGANGTFENPGNSSTVGLNGSGQLVLDGNASSAWVSLPSGILPQLTNATFEIWVNEQNPQTWAELWTFGTNNGSAGQQFLSMIPVDGGLSGQIGLDNGHGPIAGGLMPTNQEICLTAVYNYSAQTASIYVNGTKTGSGAVTFPISGIPDPDNYIGQSQFYGGGDPYFQGTIDEFRIYSGPQSDLQVAIDAAAGPNNIVTNPGALSSLTVTVPSTNVDIHGATIPIQVLANFANVSGVNVSTLSQTTITSGNPSVGTILNGNFVPENPGLCTVTAKYGGLAASVTLTVVDTEPWPTLLHRWRFNEPPGSTTLTDVVATINGTINGPVTFTGQAMATPDPNPVSASDGLPTSASGWVAFPSGQGIVSGLPNEASLEIWVVWDGGPVWQEMFDFGQATTPGYSLGGYEYAMISPYDGNNTFRFEWDQNPIGYDITIEGPHPLPTNVLCQIVWTHDQDRQLDKVYVNGQLIGSAVNTALWSSLPDSDNWLARDEWQDPMFNGQYWDFRIWNGALTAGQVANLYAAGPAVLAAPTLQIAATASQQMNLTWPANATAFTLQSATNVLGPWTSVTGTLTVTNGLNNLTVPANQSQAYYRLAP